MEVVEVANEENNQAPLECTPELQYQVFVNNVNCLLGHLIVEAIFNDNEEVNKKHKILGTIENQFDISPPLNVDIIEKENHEDLLQSWIKSDILIYDLNFADLDEIEYAIKTLQSQKDLEKKKLILVSSVMTWAMTPQKKFKKGSGDTEQIKVKSFTENEYEKRVPLPKYEMFKVIEDQAIEASKENPNIETFILCSGVLYGLGENVFFNHFNQAWHQDPMELSIIGNGNNFIPTIHIKDLVNFIIQAFRKTPKTIVNESESLLTSAYQYIFAVDHGIKNTYSQIVGAISSGMGSGLTKYLPEEEMEQEDHFEIFKLNLKLKASKFFDIEDDEEKSIKSPAIINSTHELSVVNLIQGDVDISQKSLGLDNKNTGLNEKNHKKALKWWCKDGIPANIKLLQEEFNNWRKKQKIKVFVTGPPVCGKSYYSNKIADFAKVPHLKIQDMINSVKNLGNHPLTQKIENELSLKRKEMKAKYDEEIDKLVKKKAKTIPPPKEEFEFYPRLSEEILLEIINWRLSQNDCFNRGYVLDGFPKTYKQCRSLFLVSENDPQLKKNCFEYVISLKQSLPKILESLSTLETENTHWTEEDTKRRFAEWQKNNVPEKNEKVIEDFFRENKIGIKTVELEEKIPNIENQLKYFIEKEEAKENYLYKFCREEKEFNQVALIKENELKLIQDKNFAEESKRKEELNQQKKIEHNKKLKELMEDEKLILQQKSLSLKEYLSDYVLPILAEGLLQMTSERPNDPSEYMIQYLLSKARPKQVAPEIKNSPVNNESNIDIVIE